MIDYLRGYNFFTQSEMEDFMNSGESRVIKKGDFFVQSHNICSEIAFVKTGSFRFYNISENGNENTFYLAVPHCFITIFSSFMNQNTTAENIQALSDSSIIVYSKKVIDELQKKENFARFFKSLIEKYYFKLESRYYLMHKESAEEKFNYLIENNPLYIKYIPLKYIASYLGISPRHLSRVKSNKA